MTVHRPAPSALFPPEQDRLRTEAALSVRLHAARARIEAGSAVPTLDMAAFGAELSAFDFAGPGGLDAPLAWVIDQMEQGAVQMTHPRYFGLFNPAPTFPAECADRIVARFNPQLATATTSPVPVAIEAHVIRQVALRAGLPDGSAGHFTSGGSEANFTALICALTAAEPRYIEEGVHAFAARPVFYVSADAHLAWYKIALQAGLGHAAMRAVGTDGTGRMDADALAAMIAADEARGCRPVMVVATAGTTGAGMVDPVEACARIARAHGAWLHVDAAWGGGLIATADAGVLGPIGQADSITIDAHKWWATTMGCGLFLARDPDVLRRAFQVSTVFMPSNRPQHDPYVSSAQWSRRFMGLRLFLTLAAAGWPGLAAHIERAVGLAALMRDALAGIGWTVVNNSRLAVVCAVPPAGWPDVRAVVGHVVASGAAWVSVTTFEGRAVMRACVTHGETAPEDVQALMGALLASKDQHPGAPGQGGSH